MVKGPVRLWPVSDCTANYRPVLSSEREPYMKKKESNYHSKKLKFDHLSQKGPDTKTNWPTDRRSQIKFNFKTSSPQLIGDFGVLS
jgi:hypothetical protein